MRVRRPLLSHSVMRALLLQPHSLTCFALGFFLRRSFLILWFLHKTRSRAVLLCLVGESVGRWVWSRRSDTAVCRSTSNTHTNADDYTQTFTSECAWDGLANRRRRFSHPRCQWFRLCARFWIWWFDRGDKCATRVIVADEGTPRIIWKGTPIWTLCPSWLCRPWLGEFCRASCRFFKKAVWFDYGNARGHDDIGYQSHLAWMGSFRNNLRFALQIRL